MLQESTKARPELAREIVNDYERKNVHVRGYYSRTDLLAVAESALIEAFAQSREAQPHPFDAQPKVHADHTNNWLVSNEKEPGDVRWSLYPIGMVQRWIERAESAEAAAHSQREHSNEKSPTCEAGATPIAGSEPTNYSTNIPEPDSQREQGPAPASELIEAAEKLLEWVPPCSLGSSGDLRQKRLRAAIDKFGRDGSLNKATGVKADLEHPGNDTGGETAKTLRSQAAREIAEKLEVHTRPLAPGYEEIIAILDRCLSGEPHV